MEEENLGFPFGDPSALEAGGLPDGVSTVRPRRQRRRFIPSLPAKGTG